jgi:hypothetical protein
MKLWRMVENSHHSSNFGQKPGLSFLWGQKKLLHGGVLLIILVHVVANFLATENNMQSVRTVELT